MGSRSFLRLFFGLRILKCNSEIEVLGSARGSELAEIVGDSLDPWSWLFIAATR